MNPPLSDLSSKLIVASLTFIALYVLLVNADRQETYRSLEFERKRRTELEEKLRAREDDLDGALAKIHELNPDADRGE